MSYRRETAHSGTDAPAARSFSLLLLILLALPPAAQSDGAAPPVPASRGTALVRRAIQNREAATRTHRPLRFLLRKIDQHHDTTKDIIETNQGNVARLVAINGRPLTAEANQAELDRLNTLANHPEIQEHRQQREQKDAARVNRLMLLLPDAFLYREEGTSPCPSGEGVCHHLTFSPNPTFEPPDVEANIFRGLAGEVWIDQAQERLTRLDAHVIAKVDFGWGILGKLDKGGTIQLEQSDIGNHDWELTTLKLNLTGKALMLKSLSIQLSEQTSHFSTIPAAVDYRKAIQLLQNPERVMIAKTPEHAVDLLDQAFNQGDLEGVLRYYDNAAVVIPIPGTQARGTQELRALYQRFMRPGVTAKQIKTNVIEADGIALFTSRWTLNIQGEPPQTFIANTVFRRQPDGGWKALIDNARGPEILDQD